jgi:hypothetical protein
MVLNRDDPRLVIDGGLRLDRARLMSWWFALNRSDSDRLVNLPRWRLLVDFDVVWEREL